MNFQKDYTNFFDIHEFPIFQQTQFLNDFVAGMSELLCEDFNVDEVRAAVIARTVAGTMLVPGVHYHSPIHVLSMLQFAENNEIELLTTEKLAVFFHDAIYIPGQLYGVNEKASTYLMRGLMLPHTGEGVMDEVAYFIDGTGRHTDRDVGTHQRLIMDLDLCGFAFENQEIMFECLKKESGLEDEFVEARKNFLKVLIAKGFIFRTSEFKQFEDKAMANAKTQIEE